MIRSGTKTDTCVVHGGKAVLLVTALILAIAPAARAADLHKGQMLRDALIELNRDGAAMLFSSELVTAEMYVVQTPKPGSPLQMAREILAPHGLTLEAAPGDRWLVAQSTKRVPATSTSDAVPSQRESTARRETSIDEMVVISSRYQIYGDSQVAEFNNEQIDRLPHLADDLMRAISRLPAAAADDFSARINLRGGTRDETAVYLDGLKLVDPFHLKDLQGALSIIDSNLIDSADILPGGFAARYGNQASGIVNIETLPVAEQTVHSVGVSFVNAFANTRGSFDDGRGGWLVSVRRGYLDWLFQLVDTGSGEFTPRYLDFLAKVEHDIGDRQVLSGHVLAAQDDMKYRDDSEDTLVDGNADTLFLWGRLRSFWSDSLTSDSVLWRKTLDRTRVITMNDPNGINANVTDIRDIESLGLRSDWRWQLNDGWSISFGVESTEDRVEYDYSLISTINSSGFPGRPPINRQTLLTVDGGTLQIYSSARKDFGKFAAEFGWRRNSESYTTLDETVSGPRLNFRYDLAADTKLLFAWGDYYQFQPAEGLQVEDGIDQFARATAAEHRIVGFEHRFDAALSLRVDAYQKQYRHLAPRFVNLFDAYEPIPEAKPDRYRVDADTAEARGIEISLRRNAERGLSWWLGYAYSKVEDQIAGVDVPREWDQPHALNAVVNWQGERWNINLASAWRSGWPRTEAELGLVDTPLGPQPGVVPSIRNSGRYDNYLRVDARISRNVNLTRGTFTYFFEIYNLLDTENSCCIDEQEVLPGPLLLLDEENWLPRMPSFGFTWTFE